MSLTPHLVKQAVMAEMNQLTGFSAEEADEIFRYGAYVGSSVEHFPEAARCMDLARERIAACEAAGLSFTSGTALIADRLSGGKGRFLRSWHAPSGGVWMVLVLVNTLLPESSRLYPLAAGVACCETVRHYRVNGTIKWVNDLLVGGRKLAGILIETVRGARYGEEYLLVGIGLNVNNTRFPPELSQRAAAMIEFVGRELDVTEVAAVLLARLRWNIGLLHHAENERLEAAGLESPEYRNPLLQSWRALSDTIGRRVRFGFNVIEKPLYTAKVVDVDQQGQLVMKLADGSLVTENSGEIIYL